MQLLSCDDGQIRAKAAFALGWTGDERAREALSAAHDDADSTVRYAALDALRKLDAPLPFDRLARILDEDPDGLVRAAAARALDQWYANDARTLLRQQLDREHHADARRVLAELVRTRG